MNTKRMLYLKITSRILILSMQPVPVSEPVKQRHSISDSVRGVDLYILADVLNYSLKYKVCGHENHMSPDDIYADVKRIMALLQVSQRALLLSCRSFMRAVSIREAPESL